MTKQLKQAAPLKRLLNHLGRQARWLRRLQRMALLRLRWNATDTLQRACPRPPSNNISRSQISGLRTSWLSYPSVPQGLSLQHGSTEIALTFLREGER